MLEECLDSILSCKKKYILYVIYNIYRESLYDIIFAAQDASQVSEESEGRTRREEDSRAAPETKGLSGEQKWLLSVSSLLSM